MFAITPRGVGNPVGARKIRANFPLVEGETFTVEDWNERLVLSEDGRSLRERGTAEDLAVARRRARDLINAERDRRVMAGQTVDVGAGKMISVDTRNDRDLGNVNGLVTVAILRQSSSDLTPIEFRGAGDTTYELTAGETITLGTMVAAAVAAIYSWSWDIKDQVSAATSVESIVSLLTAQSVPGSIDTSDLVDRSGK